VTHPDIPCGCGCGNYIAKYTGTVDCAAPDCPAEIIAEHQRRAECQGCYKPFCEAHLRAVGTLRFCGPCEVIDAAETAENDAAERRAAA
jgi:hypothetical protein